MFSQQNADKAGGICDEHVSTENFHMSLAKYNLDTGINVWITILYFWIKIVSEYDQEITQITNRRQPHGTARKSHTTITRHQEDKLSKAISSLFLIKMTAKLEWTYSYIQQNIEQLQTPTMEVAINKSQQRQNHCLRTDSSQCHQGL